MKPTYQELKSIMADKGYKFFNSAWSVNVIGIRNPESTNKFGCTMCIAYRDDNFQPIVEYFPCTTVPGTHWLLNPLSSNGAAIIMEGQYRGVYKVGIHNRSRPSKSYAALEQVKPMKYFRDNNKNSIVDANGKVYSGIFKTNIHRASSTWVSQFVDKWSAGCQVITGPENWKKFMKICSNSTLRYGNSITYTLLNKNDFTI
jgi:hypothetical protein